MCNNTVKTLQQLVLITESHSLQSCKHYNTSRTFLNLLCILNICKHLSSMYWISGAAHACTQNNHDHQSFGHFIFSNIPLGLCHFGPVHTYADIFKNGGFFSVLALRPHVNGVFGMRKRRFLKTLSRVEVFENAVFVFTRRRVKTVVFENVVFVFTCGRVKTEVFENDDVIIGSSLATRVLSVVLCTFSRWQTKSVWLFYLS